VGDIESLGPNTGKQVEQAQRFSDRFACVGRPVPVDQSTLPPAVASICFSCPQIFPESHRHMDWLLVEKMCPRERAFACAARLIAPVLFVF
jgi:hypothetical protein